MALAEDRELSKNAPADIRFYRCLIGVGFRCLPAKNVVACRPQQSGELGWSQAMRDSQFPQFFWFYCVPPLSISLMVAALRNKAVLGFGLEVRVSFRRARYSHGALANSERVSYRSVSSSECGK